MTDIFVSDAQSPEAAGLLAVGRSAAEHPAIARAVALIRIDGNGDERLLVYAEPVNGVSPPTSEQLREFLAVELPGHSVPDVVTVLEALPLAPSGEVDHRALPDPRPTGSVAARSIRAALLCELFAAVLGVPAIRMEDDFFDAGGHSMLTTRLVRHIRSITDLDVTVRDVFDAETMGELIERLDRQGRPHQPLARAAHPARLPASVRQRYAFTRVDGERPGPTRQLAMRLTGTLDQEALRAALADVVVRHEALRTSHEVGGSVPWQVVAEPAQVRPELAVVAATEDELPARLQAPVGQPLAATGRPTHPVLFRIGPDEHVLSLPLAGMAIDRRSAELVRRDLISAYRARHDGRPPVWPVLPIQATDWAIWESTLLGTEDDPQSLAARQLAYWRESLANLPAELALPVDRSRPQRSSRRGDAVPLRMPAELSERLPALARQHKATVEMVLQAGIAVLLTRLGAGSDLPLGVVVEGRSDPALDDVVGMLANALVLRIDTAGNPTFGEVVTRVRTIALAADGRRDVPFELIASRLQPCCPPSRHPLFQVATQLHTAGPSSQAAGLTVADAPVSAPFDLDLSFEFRQALDTLGAPAGLDGELRYATELFDRATADRIGRSLLDVLEAAASDPARPIDDLPITGLATGRDGRPGPAVKRTRDGD